MAEPERWRWTETDPLGQPIHCGEAEWQHVLARHRELAPYEAMVRAAIRYPQVIYDDLEGTERLANPAGMVVDYMVPAPAEDPLYRPLAQGLRQMAAGRAWRQHGRLRADGLFPTRTQIPGTIAMEAERMSADTAVASLAEQIIAQLPQATWDYNAEIGEMNVVLPGGGGREAQLPWLELDRYWDIYLRLDAETGHAS